MHVMQCSDSALPRLWSEFQLALEGTAEVVQVLDPPAWIEEPVILNPNEVNKVDLGQKFLRQKLSAPD
jgi:hypothetical protein